MSNKLKDLTNKQFNQILVLEKTDKKSKEGFIWKCKCILCSKEFEVATVRLTRTTGSIKNCGCKKYKSGNKSLIFKGVGELSHGMFSAIKKGCFNRSKILKFDLTIEQLWDLFLKQNKKCALSGLDILLLPQRKMRGKGTASLDRIDSNKDYIIDNVQWVHKDINKMKMDLDQKYFIEMCKNVVTKEQMEI